MSPRFCRYYYYYCCLPVLLLCTRNEEIWKVPRDRFHSIECGSRTRVGLNLCLEGFHIASAPAL